jgi:hypothetical protein
MISSAGLLHRHQGPTKHAGQHHLPAGRGAEGTMWRCDQHVDYDALSACVACFHYNGRTVEEYQGPS